MRLALDTNAYRALSDGNPKLAQAVKRASSIGLPITVVGELYYGFLNGNKAGRNIEDLDRFRESSRVETLIIDEATARGFGEIATLLRQSGKPIQQNDIWIAALSKQYDYTLATNDRDFKRVLGLTRFEF